MAYAEQVLAPELFSDDIVVIDNLPARRITGVPQAIEKIGARLLFLPCSVFAPWRSLSFWIEAFDRCIAARTA